MALANLHRLGPEEREKALEEANGKIGMDDPNKANENLKVTKPEKSKE